MFSQHRQAGKLTEADRATADRTDSPAPISREGYSMTTPLKDALVALTDALAKRPAQEVLFQWFCPEG
jgi:hypothetical protein